MTLLSQVNVAKIDRVLQTAAASRCKAPNETERQRSTNRPYTRTQVDSTNLRIPASQPTVNLLKQLAGLRLDAIPCHRDRGSTAFGDQRHHPGSREVTSRPTAWTREVVEKASH